jgi:hypothetical protein
MWLWIAGTRSMGNRDMEDDAYRSLAVVPNDSLNKFSYLHILMSGSHR